MTLLGYVSDERYLALSDVTVEISDDRSHWTARSTATGAIHADLSPGEYRVTLAKDGYGAKHADVALRSAEPHQFRLLSDQICGYVWPKWARSGDEGEFRIHSPEPYRLSLWRHGAAAEETALIGWFDEHAPRATVQVTPDGDYTQVGVRFNEKGYADPSHRQYVTAPDRSGLYYFHVEGESGARFSFPWVVAPRQPTAPIAVIASTNTWNAYNNFGGRSNYINASGLPSAPVLVPRLEMPRYLESSFSEHALPDDTYPPLSFERPEPLNQLSAEAQPEDPIRGRQPCHLAAAEWRLLSWLERNGYEYDLYSDAHLHDGTLPLDSYRALVLSTHPEYWSREMYSAVHSWVHDRGGKLANFGGNVADCEVVFSADALHFRTQAVDPVGPYESRMHRTFRPTSELFGVVFTSAGAMTGAPYEVIDPGHWAFRGTGLGKGDLFGDRSLHERCPGGASGHETDKTGPHSPQGTHVLARGLNPGDGGGEIACYATASGGEGFSVGSIAWTSAVLVDNGVSAVTANVLDRFIGRS